MSKTALKITRKENFADWYQELVKEGQLADNACVRGCMVIKPYGYAIWENMKEVLDKKIKDLPDSVTEEYINRLKEVYQIVSDMLVAQEKANNSSEILPRGVTRVIIPVYNKNKLLGIIVTFTKHKFNLEDNSEILKNKDLYGG